MHTVCPKSLDPFYIVSYYLYEMSQEQNSTYRIDTVCPRSSDQFYVANLGLKWVKTYWTYSNVRKFNKSICFHIFFYISLKYNPIPTFYISSLLKENVSLSGVTVLHRIKKRRQAKIMKDCKDCVCVREAEKEFFQWHDH